MADDYRCQHVKSGKRKVFAAWRIAGIVESGDEEEITVETCDRCYGGFVWMFLEKLPEGACMRLSRDGKQLKMSWAAEP